MSLTDDDPAAKPAAPPLAQLPGLDLGSLVASRLCHDLISPASAIASGLDLLDDPQAQDMRDDAMALIAGSARKLVDILQFSRVAFGGGGESYSREELEELAKGVFAHHRGDLTLVMTPAALNRSAARALTNLVAIAAAALPMGGAATIRVEPSEGGIGIAIDAAGPRARLRPELLAGLNGEGPGEGLAGHWIQAAWTQALIAQAGGRIAVTAEDGRVVLNAWMPG